MLFFFFFFGTNFKYGKGERLNYILEPGIKTFSLIDWCICTALISKGFRVNVQFCNKQEFEFNLHFWEMSLII